MLIISSFSNFVNELLMPIAQKDTAIAIVIVIATIMIVEITILIPFSLRRRFLVILKIPFPLILKLLVVESLLLVFRFCGYPQDPDASKHRNMI